MGYLILPTPPETNAMYDDDLASPALARALAMRERAEAQAKAVLENTEARLQALIEEGNRRMRESACQQAASALGPPRLRMEQAAKACIYERLPLTDEFKQAVSIRASQSRAAGLRAWAGRP